MSCASSNAKHADKSASAKPKVTFGLKFNNHKAYIKMFSGLPVSEPFSEAATPNFISKSRFKGPIYREMRDSSWIHKLKWHIKEYLRPFSKIVWTSSSPEHSPVIVYYLPLD